MGTPPIYIIVLFIVSVLLCFFVAIDVVQRSYGEQIVPHWLIENILLVLYSFYPFTILFYVLDTMFFGPEKKRETSIYHYGPVLHWGYMLCIAVHFSLLFGVGLSFFKAFGAAFGACLVVPIFAYRIFRPMQVRHAGTERMTPDEVAAVARQHDSFARFLTTAGHARVFVTDNEHRFTEARVCALHRLARPEDPSIIQDTVFEVQVNMRRRRVVEGSEVFQSYLYRLEENGCSVLVLPIQSEDWRPGVPAEIDRVTLEQLRTVPDRFPSLDRYPLPIASRGREAFEVSEEEIRVSGSFVSGTPDT